MARKPTSGAIKRRLAPVHKGMGFSAAQSNIAKRQGISQERAGAILAASTRNASRSAKKANPNLNKVKG
jgi:acetyl-CoA acetyltransferase